MQVIYNNNDNDNKNDKKEKKQEDKKGMNFAILFLEDEKNYYHNIFQEEKNIENYFENYNTYHLECWIQKIKIFKILRI